MSLSNFGLDAFYEVYKQKTVYGAADSLGLTPTAVTQRVRSLEKELSTTLFIRTKKGMLLSPAGEKLLKYVQSRELLESETISQITNESYTTPIKIRFSASTYFTYSVLLPNVKILKENHPSLFFDFDVNDSANKIIKLKQNQVDFIAIPRDQVTLELDSKLLGKRKYILVGGEKFKSSHKELAVIDYSESDPFTNMFFRKSKIKASILPERHFINNTMMLPRLIESNLGVAALDIEQFNESKKHFKIYNLFPNNYYEIEWAIAWMPRLEMPGYFQKIINTFK